MLGLGVENQPNGSLANFREYLFVVLLIMLHSTQELEPPADPAPSPRRGVVSRTASARRSGWLSVIVGAAADMASRNDRNSPEAPASESRAAPARDVGPCASGRSGPTKATTRVRLSASLSVGSLTAAWIDSVAGR